MEFKVALAQTTSAQQPEENLKKAEEYLKKASQRGAFMIVFPEYFMNYYPEQNYVKKAQNLSGFFVMQMQKLAQKYKLWILFGMNQKALADEKSYNTIVCLSSQGKILGTYQKTHLFDAFSWKESQDTVPGDGFMTPVQTPAGRLGIGTCYDLRFPEVARDAALQGAQVICYPSAWVRGEGKYLQWKTLLRARAIENELYVLGCCHYSAGHYMGRSVGFGPDGKKLYEGGEGEELLIARICPEKVREVRRANPVFENLRKDLYPRVNAPDTQ